MADAEEIATRLAYDFLRNGQFSAAHGLVEVPSLAKAAAATAAPEFETLADDGGFGNIAVQSVGFEEDRLNLRFIYTLHAAQLGLRNHYLKRLTAYRSKHTGWD